MSTLRNVPSRLGGVAHLFVPIRPVPLGRRLLAVATIASISLVGCGDGGDEGGDAAPAGTERAEEEDVTDTSGPADTSASSSGESTDGSDGDVDPCTLVPDGQLTAVANGPVQQGDTVSEVASTCIFEPQDDAGGEVYVTFVHPGVAFYEDLQAEDPDGEAVSVGSEAMMWIGDVSSSIGVLADDALIHIEVQHGSPRPDSDDVRVALLGAAEAALVSL